MIRKWWLLFPVLGALGSCDFDRVFEKYCETHDCDAGITPQCSPPQKQLGDSCSFPSECCSGICEASVCRAAGTACKQAGELCNNSTDCCLGSACGAGRTCYSLTGGVGDGGQIGTPCTVGNDCVSGFCADGYCCTSACNGSCDNCSLQRGTCLAREAGLPGNPNCSPFVCNGSNFTCPSTCSNDNHCAIGYFCNLGTCVEKRANGQACQNLNSQCASNFCVDGVCCNTACGAECDSCNVAGSEGTCALSPNTTVCGVYRCLGNAATCRTSCTSDTHCAPGNYCNGSNQCIAKQPNGTGCTLNSQCGSGQCVDGVCCNSACGGPCDACNVTGNIGQCTPVAAGAPGDPSCNPYLCSGGANCRTSCSAAEPCAGTISCNAGSCGLLPPGASCTSPAQCTSNFCVDGVCCNNGRSGACEDCNIPGSLGSCKPKTAGSMAPCGSYSCNGVSGICPTSCDEDLDCATANYCDISGSCKPKNNPGASCFASNECVLGFCVDGFCCDNACTGQCQTCASTPGTCKSSAQGSPGSPTCDPFVCNGTAGTCPMSCGSDLDCTLDRYCSGLACLPKKLKGQSCTAGNQCATGNCVDGVCCNTNCSGACNACNIPNLFGSCSPNPKPFVGNPSCGPYVCNGVDAGCPTFCTNDSDCDAQNYCKSGGTCVARLELGQFCTLDTNCKSDHCADGVCCDKACEFSCDVCNSAGTCGVRSQGSPGFPPCQGGTTCSGNNNPYCPACTQDSECGSANFCDQGSPRQCRPKRGLGSSCSGNNECSSGQCPKGFCCNAPCSGTCFTCSNLTGGNCQVAARGTDPHNECPGSYDCSGSGDAGCLTTCFQNSDCKPNLCCTSPTCGDTCIETP